MGGKAESRLIYNSISVSERVASLGVDGALLFTWLITHCDSQGRMPGKPTRVKQLVVPFFDEITVDNVKESLDAMVKKNLIFQYHDKTGRCLIQIKDWWDWQTGLRYRSASHYEAPEGWKDIVTSRDEHGKFKEDVPE